MDNDLYFKHLISPLEDYYVLGFGYGGASAASISVSKTYKAKVSGGLLVVVHYGNSEAVTVNGTSLSSSTSDPGYTKRATYFVGTVKAGQTIQFSASVAGSWFVLNTKKPVSVKANTSLYRSNPSATMNNIAKGNYIVAVGGSVGNPGFTVKAYDIIVSKSGTTPQYLTQYLSSDAYTRVWIALYKTDQISSITMTANATNVGFSGVTLATF